MSILFCTPCYGSQVTEPYFRSCLQLQLALASCNFPHSFFTLSNDSLVTRARNVCVANFLKTDFESMMFIDADIEFSVDDVGMLLEMDQPISVGVYRMKKPGSKYAAWRDGELVDDLDQFTRPITVDYAGTGFMLIKREVFTEIYREYPEWKYEEGQVGDCFGYFQDPIMDGFHMSEDYFFCRTWRDLGHEVWMHPKVRLTHHGVFGYGDDEPFGRPADRKPARKHEKRKNSHRGNGKVRVGGP